MIKSGPSSLNEWFSPPRFAVLAACLIAACFLPVIMGTETFFFRDFAIFSYPIAAYHRECFWNGELPLWNPYNNCGLPLLAQWNTLLLYPLSLIYLLLPLPWSLNIFCLAHFWLAAAGMYFLARRWTGSEFASAAAGLGFIFSGVMLSCLKWPNNIAALGWMPWVVLAVDRALGRSWRKVAVAALVGGMQMLCGAPEIIFLTWILCALLAAHAFCTERPWNFGIPLRFGAIVALVAGLAAAQLLPFLELMGDSQRDESFAHAQWPMPPWGWANYFVPLFRTFESYHGVHAQPGQYWISTYYVSLALAMAGICGLIQSRSSKFRLMGVLTVLSIWLAAGERGGLYSWAHDHIPGLGLMRFPVKFVVLAAFLLPLLGAHGVSVMLSSTPKKPLLPWVGGLILAMVAGIALFNELKPFPAPVSICTGNALWRGVFLIAGLACLLRLQRQAPERRRLAALGFTLVLVLDGLSHAPWQNPAAPHWVYDGTTAEIHPKPNLGSGRAMISPEAAFIIDHLKLDLPSEDVLASRASLYCNVNLLDRIPKVDGFFSLYPRPLAEVVDALYAGTNRPPAGILDFLGVGAVQEKGSWQRWEKRAGAAPLVQAPRTLVVVTNAAREILSESFNPREAAFLEEAAEAFDNSEVEVMNLAVDSQSLAFSVKTGGRALLVIAQTWEKNWRAEVGRQPVPILRVNHAFQAIAVPPGVHQVTLRYTSGSFKLGSVVSGLSALIVAILSLFGARLP